MHGRFRELRLIGEAELDLDAVRIDKVEHRPDADIADLRARDLPSVKPSCPRLQVLELRVPRLLVPWYDDGRHAERERP
jgi:hypothetical protein